MRSTSRWPQHSTPSSGGRRQRHERNLITAADTAGVGLGGAVEVVLSAGAPGWGARAPAGRGGRGVAGEVVGAGGPPGWAPWAAAGRVGSFVGSFISISRSL